MMPRPSLVFLTFLCFLGATTALARGTEKREAEKRFDAANTAFAGGSFEEAIADYEAILESGAVSPELFSNLASAYYRRGNRARALLNFYRALVLKPGMKEAVRGFELAAGTLDGEHVLRPEMARARALGARYRGRLLGVGAVGFWLCLLCAAALRRLPGGIRKALAFAGGGFFSLSMLAALGLHFVRPTPRTAWVVAGEEVALLKAPSEASGTYRKLQPAEEVVIRSRLGEWYYAETGRDSAGWIPAADLERVLIWAKAPE